MIDHSQIDDRDLWRLIRSKQILFAGNRRLKIFGTLDCVSGRRMKRDNRIFFVSEDAAAALGFRPCGHCMPNAYRNWRSQSGRVGEIMLKSADQIAICAPISTTRPVGM